MCLPELNTQEAVAWHRTLAQFCRVGEFHGSSSLHPASTPSSKDGKASVHGGTPTTKTGEAHALAAWCFRTVGAGAIGSSGSDLG